MKLKIEKIVVCYGVSLHGKDEVDRVGGITKSHTRYDVLLEKELIEAKDIAANAVSKPGTIPTLFHVMPENHYNFMVENYKNQPTSNTYGIDDISDLQLVYFNSSEYTEIKTKGTKKKPSEKVYKLPIKTSKLASKFEPENWKSEDFTIHASYFDTSRFEYNPEKLFNESYKELKQRLKIT